MWKDQCCSVSLARDPFALRTLQHTFHLCMEPAEGNHWRITFVMSIICAVCLFVLGAGYAKNSMCWVGKVPLLFTRWSLLCGCYRRENIHLACKEVAGLGRRVNNSKLVQYVALPEDKVRSSCCLLNVFDFFMDYVFQICTGNLCAVVSQHYQPINVIRFSDDRVHLVSGGEDSRVIVWRLNRYS